MQQVLARTKGPYLGKRKLYIFYTHDCCTVIMVYTFARGCCIRIQRAREAKNYTYKRRGTRYIYIYMYKGGPAAAIAHTHYTRTRATPERCSRARRCERTAAAAASAAAAARGTHIDSSDASVTAERLVVRSRGCLYTYRVYVRTQMQERVTLLCYCYGVVYGGGARERSWMCL